MLHFKIIVCLPGVVGCPSDTVGSQTQWPSRVCASLQHFVSTGDDDRLCADVACFSINRSLEQLLVSLQWGRQQTYYPSAQPLSTGELAAANHKLADAINSHLLGNTSSSVVKSSSAKAEHLCSTPAEKMAEKVRTLYPRMNLTTVWYL